MQKNCLFCGKRFTYKRYWKKYCSKKCRIRFFNSKNKTKNNERSRKYYYNHKAKIDKDNREYYYNHKKQMKRYGRNYYSVHKTKMNKQSHNYYLKNKEKRKKYIKKWIKKNRFKYNQSMARAYKKNRKKWDSRSRTLTILKSKRKKVKLEKKCKTCNSLSHLEIHHEIYPTTAKKNRKAIEDGKIYYLCKKHHILQSQLNL